MKYIIILYTHYEFLNTITLLAKINSTCFIISLLMSNGELINYFNR